MSSTVTDTGGDDLAKMARELELLGKLSIEAGFINLDSKTVITAGNAEFGARIPVSQRMRNFFLVKGYPLKASTQFITIPETAPIRNSFDHPGMLKAIAEALADGLEDIIEGSGTAQKTAVKIGEVAASFIRERVKSNLPPDQHPLTLSEKAGGTRLIKSGKLFSKIGYEVAS